MFKLLQYYSRAQALRGNLGGLPQWARVIVFLFALPGILGVALSILALLVSILALLLLTVPVYGLLKRWVGGRRLNDWHDEATPAAAAATFVDPGPEFAAAPPSGRRRVEVKIVEPGE